MAKIDLRAYYEEIDDLINRGRYDDAIAHCRNILQVFPKSVQTYRLLGKAFLEARRYADAVNIFQRVLSALPSDFVSHLGLSIIREDEGNLDAAIWHMERAFEIQPYNGAIQEELRRLYERRDGSAPAKVRLTKSALARMYAKGNLYQQAAAEARGILSADPQRVDVQLLLAGMYLKSGKSVEAAEIATKVLNRLPYSLEANQILVRILENSDHKEEYRQYKDRLISLDPYEARVTGDVTDTSQVPGEVVQIDRLDIAGEQLVPSDSPADWMTSLGLTASDFETELDDELPEWLVAASEQIHEETGEDGLIEAENEQLEELLISGDEDIDSIEWLGQVEEGQDFSSEDILETDEISAEEQVDLPDWMLEAGWQERTEESVEMVDEEPTPDLDELEVETPAAAADLPDWLRDLAPDDLSESAEAQTEQDKEDSNLAAMFDHADEDHEIPFAAAAAAGMMAAEEFTEHLKDEQDGVEDAELTAEEEKLTAEELIPQGGEEVEADLPDWLQEFDVESEAETIDDPTGAASIPEWLTDIDSEAAIEEAAESSETADQVIQAQPVGDLPDWLVEFEDQTSQPEPEPEAGDDLPDWLQDIEDTGTEQEIISETEETQQDITKEPPVGSPESGIELEEPPDFADAEDAMSWLAGLAAVHGLQGEAPAEESPPAEEIESPMHSSKQVTEEYSQEDQQPVQPASQDSDQVGEIELESPPDFEDMDEAVSWLEKLAQGTSASTVEEISPADPSETEAEQANFNESEYSVSKNKIEEREKIDLNKASLVEIEKLPGVGFRTAQLIVAYRDSQGPFVNLDDIADIPGIEPDDVFTLQEYFFVDLKPEEAPPTSQPPTNQADQATLTKARQAANEGDLETSLQTYNQLVSKGVVLDDVIFDLNQQLQSRPDNIELWQMLGDAYMRNNQLIEAMQAYNRAEELLH